MLQIHKHAAKGLPHMLLPSQSIKHQINIRLVINAVNNDPICCFNLPPLWFNDSLYTCWLEEWSGTVLVSLEINSNYNHQDSYSCTDAILTSQSLWKKPYINDTEQKAHPKPDTIKLILLDFSPVVSVINTFYFDNVFFLGNHSGNQVLNNSSLSPVNIPTRAMAGRRRL